MSWLKSGSLVDLSLELKVNIQIKMFMLLNSTRQLGFHKLKISFQELCTSVKSTPLVSDLNCLDKDKFPLVAQSASLAYIQALVVAYIPALVVAYIPALVVACILALFVACSPALHSSFASHGKNAH